MMTGCSLETVEYGQINTSMFPKTPSDAEALVAGCYSYFGTDWRHTDDRSIDFNGIFDPGQGIQIDSEIASDIGERMPGQPRDIAVIIYGNWKDLGDYAAKGTLERHWKWVSKLNGMLLTIDRLEQIDMDETRKAQLIAEVHCARGLMAYLLYDFFGGVPIADLETLKNPLAETILPRYTDDQMETFIEDELTTAIAGLPDVYKKGDREYGRFSKGIAYTVLLKFYMLTEQWDKAVNVGAELTSGKYGYALVPRYKDIFTMANEKNEETIFSSNAVVAMSMGACWHSAVVPTDYPVVPENLVSYGAHSFAWRFVLEKYDPADQRLETIVTEYTGTAKRHHSKKEDEDIDGPLKYGAIPMKYEMGYSTKGYESEIDFIIYRYADVLTLYAEALVRHAKNITPEAVELLNQVRRRAGLPNLENPTDFPNGVPSFYNEILDERGRELYWEGTRRQDLIRHNKYIEAMQQKAEDAGPGSTQIKTRDFYRFPLPRQAIVEGKGVITQNPGYSSDN
jgi:hypothetical protein